MLHLPQIFQYTFSLTALSDSLYIYIKQQQPQRIIYNFFNVFTYGCDGSLWLLLFGLFSGFGDRGLLMGLLFMVAPLVSEHRLQVMRASVVTAHGLSSCGSWALEHRLNCCDAWAQFAPWHVWPSWIKDYHVSHLGRWTFFFTTEPSRKPPNMHGMILDHFTCSNRIFPIPVSSPCDIAVIHYLSIGYTHTEHCCYYYLKYSYLLY